MWIRRPSRGRQAAVAWRRARSRRVGAVDSAVWRRVIGVSFGAGMREASYSDGVQWPGVRIAAAAAAGCSQERPASAARVTVRAV